MPPSTTFSHDNFRAAIFAAFVTQDWGAVGNALTIMQDVTGMAILGGDPSSEQVMTWARSVTTMLAADGAYLDAHGEAHPRLQCRYPACRTHGQAVRARIARKHAQALREAAAAQDAPQIVAQPEEQAAPKRGTQTVILMRPVPGVH